MDNNGINMDTTPQLVSLPDFWTINSILKSEHKTPKVEFSKIWFLSTSPPKQFLILPTQKNLIWIPIHQPVYLLEMSCVGFDSDGMCGEVLGNSTSCSSSRSSRSSRS